MAVDPQKIEQQLATMIADLAPFCDGSSPNNVLARMQSQVIPAFIRWKTQEMERGSDENSVLNAFVALASSQLVSLVCEVVGSTDTGDDHFKVANTVLLAVGEEIGAILSGNRQMASYSVAAERTH